MNGNRSDSARTVDCEPSDLAAADNDRVGPFARAASRYLEAIARYCDMDTSRIGSIHCILRLRGGNNDRS